MNAEEIIRGKKLITCSNTLILRFCLYGFLKNQKYFEPFLIVILQQWGLSLTTIGFLISIEKITCYLMELPSGYLSDRYGARTTLCSCFLLYIISFICYYFGKQEHILFLVMASFFYGLAEAMRSGAHKSMVFMWLEKHKLESLKSYLNGFTRTFSLLGSATAAIAGIFFALYLDADRNLFLCAIPPYIIDLCIVGSYPSYMNTNLSNDALSSTTSSAATDPTNPTNTEKKKKKKKKKKSGKSGGFCRDMQSLLVVMKQPAQRRVVLTTAAVGVIHRVFKDFVQPIVLQNAWAIESTFESTFTGNGNSTVPGVGAPPPRTTNDTQVVILGISYFIFYLASSPASQNAYRLPSLFGTKEKKIMDGLLDSYTVALMLIALTLYAAVPVVVPFIYVTLYVIYNFSKPLSASAISDVAGKRLRATVFSADAALQTLLVAGLAPLAGFVADVSLPNMFLLFSVVLLVLNRMFFAEASILAVCCATTEKERIDVVVEADMGEGGEKGAELEL